MGRALATPFWLTWKGFTVTDIYGTEEQLMPIDTYAAQTYNEEIDGDYDTYLEKIKDQRRKDLNELYNLKEEALKEAGAIVVGVAVVVDRGAGKKIEEAGLKYLSVVSLQELGLS